jgi:hypothetical protein
MAIDDLGEPLLAGSDGGGENWAVVASLVIKLDRMRSRTRRFALDLVQGPNAFVRRFHKCWHKRRRIGLFPRLAACLTAPREQLLRREAKKVRT